MEQRSVGGLTLELLEDTNELIVRPWGKWSIGDMVGLSTNKLGLPSSSSTWVLVYRQAFYKNR